MPTTTREDDDELVHLEPVATTVAGASTLAATVGAGAVTSELLVSGLGPDVLRSARIADEQKPTSNFLRWQKRTVIALLLNIVAFLFVRSHIAITLPQILTTTRLSAPQAGLIYSFGYGAQSVGKIVNGAIIDRVGGRVMLLTGLWGAVLFSGGFALVGWQAANAVARGDAASPLYAAADTETADTTEQEGSATLLALLITLWSVVRYCQSMAWGSIMKILPRWIGEHAYGRVLGLFNLTYGLGDAAVRLMLGLLILAPGMQWWDVWMVACGMAVLFGMPTVWWVKATPRLIGEPEPGTARRLAAAARSTPSSAKTIDSTMAGTMMSAAPTTTSIATLFTRMRPILASARFWTVLFYYVGLTFVRETFLSWTAQFLSERMQLTDSASGIWSLVVPLFAAVSAMLGGYLIDRVPAREKELVSIGFLALNVVALVGLSALLASGQDTPAACLALLSLEAFGMEAPYTFIDGIYAIQIGGKESAAMTVGVIQAAGNVGGIAAGYAVGVVTHRYGWGTAFAGMAGIVGVVLLVQVLDFSKKRRNAVRGAGASAL